MSSFKGQAEYSVDAKGRVAIPAKMRAALNPEAKGTFTMTRGFERCIFLYPADEWEELDDKFAELNTYRRESRDFMRTILMWAEDVALDGQGRVTIPKPLADYAGITDRAKIIGVRDHIEMWAPDSFTDYLENQTADYETLAERVMGS